MNDSETIRSLLHSTFGFSSFLPNQEAVCLAAIRGRDVLLVMPTGSGKSLCYQLPGIALGGTTLVISPLIALMDDQVAKLKELGVGTAAIHSGRDRNASRRACIDYLEGKLRFLFIAPERLRVAGFPEMLAKRRPSLIAIDEAHCISQWGHDFRPDYRMLGQHLPNLRPAPVIALTATATPIVQDDIRKQLGLVQPASFVHGFRRPNIAIEAVEVAPAHRLELARELLLVRERRPAIVYTPTRKQADSLAAELSGLFPSAAYHAGLDAEHRQRVQREFLAGKIEVITATIAFGMGIDKANVRTVIHTALPGSIEAYYQEIGRAGRDGGSSRAILMHSYADRHAHDFFFERDYPNVTVLDAMFARLGSEPQGKAELQEQLQIDPDLFDKVLEKLWVHGGAALDSGENIRRGAMQWRTSYIAQGEQRRTRIEQMLRYADSTQCRMRGVIRHFGDLADAQEPCGICDFCAPSSCLAQQFRAATRQERELLFDVIAKLRFNAAIATGRLHRELCPTGNMDRNAFEEVLGAMARAGLVTISDTVFEKDGKQIPYRKVSLTDIADTVDRSTPIEFTMKKAPPGSGKRVAHRKTVLVEKHKQADAAKMPTQLKPQARVTTHVGSGENSSAEARLRAWRLAEAQKRRMPAFRIFGDKTLRAIAVRRPKNSRDLLAISGVGARIVEQYGTHILNILHGSNEVTDS
ncbi:MAG TPA: ATP-dependent DNA helicase RecQ [Candidatus Angelobacter sp.]|nr:ATP-dependent DNA helicase RecQ [Candidatus Angelobacter sp.]